MTTNIGQIIYASTNVYAHVVLTGLCSYMLVSNFSHASTTHNSFQKI